MPPAPDGASLLLHLPLASRAESGAGGPRLLPVRLESRTYFLSSSNVSNSRPLWSNALKLEPPAVDRHVAEVVVRPGTAP